jgi:hypothetical protein
VTPDRETDPFFSTGAGVATCAPLGSRSVPRWICGCFGEPLTFTEATAPARPSNARSNVRGSAPPRWMPAETSGFADFTEKPIV